MAHPLQLRFVALVSRHLATSWSDRDILEIGSHGVNGSIRPFFAGSRYVGVDLVAGEGVDLVGSGDEVAMPDKSVDLAVSCECFEHNPRWRETFVNMHRMTRDGGVVLITCASTGRLEHGTARTSPEQSPGTTSVGWNYYKNLSRRDFERELNLAQMFEVHTFFKNEVSKDLYFIGQRGGGGDRPLHLDVSGLRNELDAQNTLVMADQRRRLSGYLGYFFLELPMKFAQRLPDRLFQEFAIRWMRLEKTLRRGPRQ